MKLANQFLIPFVGLKLGKHQFEFEINNTFFDRFDFKEYENSAVKVSLVLEKKATVLELNFKQSGTVTVPCDQTNEIFDLPIKAKLKLIVQFGEAFNDDNEALLILPHGEFQIDVSQYIYEMIVLSVPLKRIQKIKKESGLLIENSENSKNENSKSISNQNIDPRWDKLKQLLTEK